MITNQQTKRYDLEERTTTFAKNVGVFISKLPKTMCVIEYGKQLLRSSGSIGANYIEANEAISKKDFLLRVKICRKEAKESAYWLDLLACPATEMTQKNRLMQEAIELTKIFGAIVTKSERS